MFVPHDNIPLGRSTPRISSARRDCGEPSPIRLVQKSPRADEDHPYIDPSVGKNSPSHPPTHAQTHGQHTPDTSYTHNEHTARHTDADYGTPGFSRDVTIPERPETEITFAKCTSIGERNHL